MSEPAPQAPSTAPLSFGPYRLVRRIGAGGMGEVFLAQEQRVDGLGPPLVVKKVLPHLAENRAFLGRFKDEAKVVTRLDHANVARVWSMGDVGGLYYLAMEYVQGKTVSRFTQRLRDKKAPIPVGLVLLIGERVCRGLSYAHDVKDEAGNPMHLVHRDLSPANVCISYRGEVKIIDFGAAQSTLKEEQTAPRVVIGNLTYMAPEQARKQFVDRRADVYSVGVVLWELLSWHALPQSGDPIERWRKAVNPSWTVPSLERSDLPDGLDEVILKALHRQPDQRYPDAASFGRALEQLRARYYPSADEDELGALLAAVFPREKAAEDGILQRMYQGMLGSGAASEREPRGAVVPANALAFEHRAVAAPEDFVLSDDPPSEASEASGAWVQPAPRKVLRDQINESRIIFGSAVVEPREESLEEALLREIEGGGSGPEQDEEKTSVYPPAASRPPSRKLHPAPIPSGPPRPPSRPALVPLAPLPWHGGPVPVRAPPKPPPTAASRALKLGVAVFFAALALGFAAVLLWGPS